MNEATEVTEGQDGVVGEKKKKTRRPPRNKKVVKAENNHEVVDGPNAGAKPPAAQVIEILFLLYFDVLRIATKFYLKISYKTNFLLVGP
jgi:hypothetical protein